jgi:hypothetical protein
MGGVMYPIVMITWHDSAIQDSSWIGSDALPELKPSQAFTVGMLLDQNDECVRLLQSVIKHTDNSEYGGMIVIPRGCIVEMKNL